MTEKRMFGHGERLMGMMAMLAALALVAGMAAVSAEAGNGGPTANTAKKGCKKAKKKAASSKKKKKCKKKTAAATPPVVRATLTWANGDSNDANLDLFVFSTDGKVARAGSDAIPQTSMSPNATGPSGSETFTDNLFTPQSKRDFSFGVCYTVGGSAHTPFTIKYVTADGVTHTDTQNPGSSFQYEYPGGAAIPAGYCQH